MKVKKAQPIGPIFVMALNPRYSSNLEKSAKYLYPQSSVSDPDPVGSGSVSGNVDMDPGSAKN